MMILRLRLRSLKLNFVFYGPIINWQEKLQKAALEAEEAEGARKRKAKLGNIY